MSYLPQPFQDFQRRYPKVDEAYEALGRACTAAGPLDPRTQHLVKLGIAVGGRLEGAVKSHVRRAREAGLSEDELRHVIVLALPTIGTSSMVAAATWLDEVLGAQ